MALPITQAIRRRKKKFFLKVRNKDSNPVLIISFTGHLKYDILSPEKIPHVTSISEESLL